MKSAAKSLDLKSLDLSARTIDLLTVIGRLAQATESGAVLPVGQGDDEIGCWLGK